MNECKILNGYQDRSVCNYRLTALDFCLWGWMKSEVNKIKLDTPDELLARMLDAAGCINKREDQLRRTTRDLRTPVAKCSVFDGGILEHLTFKPRNFLLNFSTSCI